MACLNLLVVNAGSTSLKLSVVGEDDSTSPVDSLASAPVVDGVVHRVVHGGPRLQEPVRRYLVSRHLTGKYSHFVIAGAGVGVVALAFKDWHKTFWDNLGASMQLHHINRVIVINHRDCGAAKIAYGEEAVASREAEDATHRVALAQFRKQLTEHHPELKVETGLMAINGRIEMMS